MPPAAPDDSMAELGALVSHGSDIRLLGVQAVRPVAKILRGAKPSESSIQTPEKLILAVNLTTARAIGLDIPRSILERADRFGE
jgi:putative tryptophan/tyrosine transport system substrate-binding protein